MEWTGPVIDLVVGLVAAAAGVFMGLRADRHIERRRQRRRETLLVQALLNRLASRRAFSHSADVGLVDDEEDRRRCNGSVLDLRDRIAGLCDQIEELDGAVVKALRQMEADCAAYLNHVDVHETRYAIALVRLRDRLYVSGLALKDIVPELNVLVPGSWTPREPEWLTL
ncbi:hypothetical protein SAMN05216184_101143 [Georgenia satyanarayanai]|uniref:Uncharacterized protein n=1 Tax=Georgenia satyanarayanai TaxID=860221 RepID=A0A2Y8ZVY4_9MICO|nr:hypothetical protein [Georgenia satyanarayanai]PYG01681.1 hypothetical protein A8987_101143 [Georgenia satyanarayanai]SSA36481.1 hypothetical protein SAMN05216184_101143 [Georgenia satyanarayanai]